MARRPGLDLGLLILFCGAPMALAGGPPAKPNPRLGINLAGPDDADTELPFVNVFYLSRPWISQKSDAPLGKGPRLELDARGWVKRIEPGCWAETILCNVPGGHYPSGEYTVFYSGRGTIEFGGSTEVTSSRPGRMTIQVEPRKGWIELRLKTTDPADPVRRIRVVMPGHERTYQNSPWNPTFLRLW